MDYLEYLDTDELRSKVLEELEEKEETDMLSMTVLIRYLSDNKLTWQEARDYVILLGAIGAIKIMKEKGKFIIKKAENY